MNSISEILKNHYSDQGIQDLKVFYDSFIFNVKVKNNTEYNNLILIEKLELDYDSGTIKQIKNGLTINFGDTGISSANYSNGNCFINSILDKSDKTLFLVGLKQMKNGNTVPVIYNYDLNKHSTNLVFPKNSDIQQFNSFTNYNFDSNSIPVVNYKDSIITLIFKSKDLNFNYLNKITFKKLKKDVELINYEIYNYDLTEDLEFINSNDGSLNFKIQDYYGLVNNSNAN